MTRIVWLDVARGLGIVLVVLGHALGGLIDSPLGAGQTGLRSTFFAVYTFHMPLFFLLSGLLVPQRIARGAGGFAKSLWPTIVWPYFLWSTVQYSVIFALGSLVNNPAGAWWPAILSLPWNTVSQFWFLYALFWLHVLALLVVPRLGGGGFLLLALALKAVPQLADLPVVVRLVCNHALFYAIGVALGPNGVAMAAVNTPRWVRLAVLPLVAAGALALTFAALPRFGSDVAFTTAASPALSHLAWRLPALLAAVAGVLACIGLASALSGKPGELFAALGRLTMPIFVLHVLFIAGTRIALVKFTPLRDPVLFLPLLVAMGLVGPLLVERLLRRLGLKRWVGF